jgi:hypothetical protein
LLLFGSEIVFKHVNDSLLVCVDEGEGFGVGKGGVVGLDVFLFYVEDLGLLLWGEGLGGGEFCCCDLGRIGGLFVLG